MIFWHPIPPPSKSDKTQIGMQVLYIYAHEPVECESIHLDLKVYAFFLTLADLLRLLIFLETYWFSSLLHTDVATVCENRTIYTDFVKASYSFCSSRLYQLFKFILYHLNLVKMVLNMNVWKKELMKVVFNFILSKVGECKAQVNNDNLWVISIKNHSAIKWVPGRNE